MVTANEVDLAAAVRVSRRVELRNIRLTHVNASSPEYHPGALKPHVEHQCSARTIGSDSIEVTCDYQFNASSERDEPVLDAVLTYLLTYEISGTEPVEAADLDHFAYASGTLHSWPFARNLLFSLTADVGYPPFMLPVLKHQQAKKAAAQEPESSTDSEEQSTEEQKGIEAKAEST